MSQVCLVIGGTGGLGVTCAKDLAKDHRIIVAGRNRQKGEAVVQQVKSAGGEATFLHFDITDFARMQDFHNDAVKIYGRLDVAINGAGMTGTFQTLKDFSTEEITTIINTNLTGVILCMQSQITLMQTNPGGSGGRIVNFSSIYGLHGTQYGSIYSATKHALVGLTRSAALEYSGPENNILINSINPGAISTEMTALLDDPSPLPEGEMKEFIKRAKTMYAQKRFGKLEDVTRGARYLIESPWVTGTTLEVDGGFGAK